jgi:predicted nucleic acid-binding protein
MWFETIAVLADVVAAEHEISGVGRDRDDDEYLAAAIEGRATFVVTGDRDLLDLGEHAGVRIVNFRQFLAVIEATIQ